MTKTGAIFGEAVIGQTYFGDPCRYRYLSTTSTITIRLDELVNGSWLYGIQGVVNANLQYNMVRLEDYCNIISFCGIAYDYPNALIDNPIVEKTTTQKTKMFNGNRRIHQSVYSAMDIDIGLIFTSYAQLQTDLYSRIGLKGTLLYNGMSYANAYITSINVTNCVNDLWLVDVHFTQDGEL